MSTWFSGTRHSCKTDSSKLWGCDEDSASTPYKVPCLCGSDKKCGDCKGSDFYRLPRCINHYLEGDTMLFFRMWEAWTNKSIAPYQGAYMDQPSMLMELFGLMDTMVIMNQNNKESA